MAIYKILRRDPAKPDDPMIETGETYDDANGPTADYVTMITARDGWVYQAIPVEQNPPA